MQFPWQFLAIPLLLFGFWLLSNLFKAAEDDQGYSASQSRRAAIGGNPAVP